MKIPNSNMLCLFVAIKHSFLLLCRVTSNEANNLVDNLFNKFRIHLKYLLAQTNHHR